jgi:hypothetical protein
MRSSCGWFSDVSASTSGVEAGSSPYSGELRSLVVIAMPQYNIRYDFTGCFKAVSSRIPASQFLAPANRVSLWLCTEERVQIPERFEAHVEHETEALGVTVCE